MSLKNVSLLKWGGRGLGSEMGCGLMGLLLGGCGLCADMQCGCGLCHETRWEVFID